MLVTSKNKKKQKGFKEQKGMLNKDDRLKEATKKDTKQGKAAKKALAKKVLK